MASQLYLDERIKKRLIPFINGHQMKDISFWPDMATSHYARIITVYLRLKNKDFVTKSQNTPNFPQARRREKFWALCESEDS
jgi:hypothetical protein